MKTKINLLLCFSLLATQILVSCKPGLQSVSMGDVEGLQDLSHLSRKSFGKLDEDKKEQLQDKVLELAGNANDQIDSFHSKDRTQGGSPFNHSFRTLGLLKHDNFTDPAKLKNLLKSDEQGFNFKCDQKADKKEGEQDYKDPSDEKNRYYLAQVDLDNMKLLNQILYHVAANQEIRDHEKALKNIPLEVAKQAFLKAYDKKGEKTVILPKGTKEALEKVQKKYKKLEELKRKLKHLKSSRVPAGELNRIKKDIFESIDDYEDIELDDKIEDLEDRGFKIAKEDKDTLDKDLDSVRKLVEVHNELEGEDVNRDYDLAQEQDEKLQEQIDALESEVGQFLRDKTKSIFEQAGNKVDDQEIKKFLSGETGKLLEQSQEAVGWEFFDPDTSFDLMKKIVDHQKDDEAQKIFKGVVEQLKVDAGDASQVKAAANFFKSYDKLKELTDEDFVKKTFLDPIAKLEEKMMIDKEKYQGNFILYNYWKSGFCPKERDDSDCKMSDVFRSFDSVEKGPELMKQMAKMLGLEFKDEKDLKEQVWLHGLKINELKYKLEEEFPACKESRSSVKSDRVYDGARKGILETLKDSFEDAVEKVKGFINK